MPFCFVLFCCLRQLPRHQCHPFHMTCSLDLALPALSSDGSSVCLVTCLPCFRLAPLFRGACSPVASCWLWLWQEEGLCAGCGGLHYTALGGDLQDVLLAWAAFPTWGRRRRCSLEPTRSPDCRRPLPTKLWLFTEKTMQMGCGQAHISF